jgi:hypothetical protein
MSLSDDDISEALSHLPALSLLSYDVRALVAASFERVSFPSGPQLCERATQATRFT